MDAILQIVYILGALSILIAIHEWGHFIAARMFGIRVEKFFLFFDAYGYKLFSIKRGDTEYGIGWLPFGGYVKIAGMVDESMDKEQMEAPPKPDEFRTKPAWQRLIVMLGGIIMNIVLAIILFIGIKFFYGERVEPIDNMTYGIYVPDSSIGWQMGLRTGDVPLAIDGEEYDNFLNWSNPNNVLLNPGGTLSVKRDGQRVDLTIPESILNDFADVKDDFKRSTIAMQNEAAVIKVDDPGDFEEGQQAYDPKLAPAYEAGLRDGDTLVAIDGMPVKNRGDVVRALDGKENSEVNVTLKRDSGLTVVPVLLDSLGRLGVLYDYDPYTDRIVYGFGGAVGAGLRETWNRAAGTMKGLWLLVTLKANPMKTMSGPVKISKMMKKSVDAGGLLAFILMTAYLSVVLAVMNLLPIPVLDGGHVIFLLIEMVIGRPVPERVQEIALQIGFFMIIALMAFVMLNDIINYNN